MSALRYEADLTYTPGSRWRYSLRAIEEYPDLAIIEGINSSGGFGSRRAALDDAQRHADAHRIRANKTIHEVVEL